MKSWPASMFGVAGAAPSMSLRNAMPCQCKDVGESSRLETVTASSSPMLARISGPGIVSPYDSVWTIGPPRSICARWAVSLAVTVCPLCGRAASAAAMAAAIWAELFVALVLDWPHPASAKPPAIPAAMKPRLVSSALPKGIPLVGSTGIDRSSSSPIRPRRFIRCSGVRRIVTAGTAGEDDCSVAAVVSVGKLGPSARFGPRSIRAGLPHARAPGSLGLWRNLCRR